MAGQSTHSGRVPQAPVIATLAKPLRTETDSPEQTAALAADLAARLRPGDVVLVTGELGSGKTTFVRGAARALGVSDAVTSPTFTIGQVYAANGLEVAHLDLYRLSTLAGEDPALLDDYLTPARIGFVEWPGVAEPELEGRGAAPGRLGHSGGDRRVLGVGGRCSGSTPPPTRRAAPGRPP